MLPAFARFTKDAPRGRYGGNVTSPEGYLLALWLHECRCVEGAQPLGALVAMTNPLTPALDSARFVRSSRQSHRHRLPDLPPTFNRRVFGDKLVSHEDKGWLDGQLSELTKAEFPAELAKQVCLGDSCKGADLWEGLARVVGRRTMIEPLQWCFCTNPIMTRHQVDEPLYFVDFLREPETDEETGEVVEVGGGRRLGCWLCWSRSYVSLQRPSKLVIEAGVQLPC